MVDNKPPASMPAFMQNNTANQLPRFILRPNLHKLACWLRWTGYFAVCQKQVSFTNSLRQANKYGYILLTRSAIEHKRATCQAVLIKANNPLQQLAQLAGVIGFNADIALSRCGLCNTKLVKVSAANHTKALPAYIAQQHQTINMCPTCGHLYWPGTHSQRIIANLKQALQQ